MPEIRLKKTREINKELNCNHNMLLVYAQSDIAPIILPEGLRMTVWFCADCGYKKEYIRKQEKFLEEINSIFPQYLNHIPQE